MGETGNELSTVWEREPDGREVLSGVRNQVSARLLKLRYGERAWCNLLRQLWLFSLLCLATARFWFHVSRSRFPTPNTQHPTFFLVTFLRPCDKNCLLNIDGAGDTQYRAQQTVRLSKRRSTHART